jgi:GT2 family glycosyltransferase
MHKEISSRVTASIVLYQHSAREMRPLFEAIARDPALAAWTVVNNGGADHACALAASLGGRCLQPRRNLGYGAAHNLAWHELSSAEEPFHVILNPDISLESGTLSELARIMAHLPETGLLMPRIVYPDGSEQRLCKLLPTPFDLFLRRFLGKFGSAFFRNRFEQYELRSLDMSIPREVPCLSGCFMFLRAAALKEVGLFDERYFMYMEDVDLCRRIGSRYKTVFYPHISIVHGYTRGSYVSLRLMRYHVHSAMKYFAKWSWFRDDEREALNRRLSPLSEIQ